MSRRTGGGVGVATVLTILLVLCLATFAALTLASAGADLRLSRTAAQRTADYYAADAEAARLFAEFRAGNDPQLETDLPVGDSQRLHLSFARDERGEAVVLCWSLTAAEELIDTTLPVWTGEAEGSITP